MTNFFTRNLLALILALTLCGCVTRSQVKRLIRVTEAVSAAKTQPARNTSVDRLFDFLESPTGIAVMGLLIGGGAGVVGKGVYARRKVSHAR